MALPEPEAKSPLESLQERLYGNGPIETAHVDPYRSAPAPAVSGWEAPPPPPPPKPRMSWTTRFLIAALAFFVVSGATAGFLFWRGTRAISSDRIEVTVTPEAPIASGDTVPLIVTVANRNPTEIFDALLVVDLPPGTRDANDPARVLETYTEPLGTIASGDSTTRTIPVQLFGSAGQVLAIPLKIEYRVPNSNALLVADRQHAITVASSPIALSVAGASQLAAGQTVSLTVAVRSNATADLRDVAVKADFPPGFTLSSAEPQATAGGLVAIGDLPAGAVRQVRITGVLRGEPGEEKVFRFAAGTKNPDGTSTLGAAFADGSAAVRLTRPNLAVSLSLNRSTEDEVIVGAGQTIPALIAWENAGTAPFRDVRIEVSLAGAALDPAGIGGGTGFYRSNDRTVVFNRETHEALASLAPGASGAGSFTVRTRSAAALAGTQQPTIELTVRARGVRDGQVVDLAPPSTRTLRVSTAVSLASSITRSGGAVPAPDQETTYAVALTARNTLNSVGGARVSAQLPEYVRFVGPLSGSSVSFDERTRTVTWTVGDLLAGATATGSFAVAFLPSASQSGTSPVVVGTQTLTGVDRFAGSVSATAPPLTVSVP